MKVEELRIGNYVLNPNGLIQIINDVECLMDANEFKPIKITEEILLKCGFERVGFGRIECFEFVGYRLGIWDIYSLENGVFSIAKNTSETILCDLKYLHQLQNLYFSLTGNELNVQL